MPRTATATYRQLWDLFTAEPIAPPGGKGTMPLLRSQVRLPGDMLDFGKHVEGEIRYYVIDHSNGDSRHPMGSLHEARDICIRQARRGYEPHRYTWHSEIIWGAPPAQEVYRIRYRSGPYAPAYLRLDDQEGVIYEAFSHADAEYYRQARAVESWLPEIVRVT